MVVFKSINSSCGILKLTFLGSSSSVVGYSNKIQGAFNDVTTSPLLHSPIIGWAYDGNPIYGPYGYSEAGRS